ncbi:hypothetical protein Angca_000886, partial [Angiostrongylus cantonensis]
MAVKVSYLIVDITLVLLQLVVITCNGFILYLFIRQKNLRQNSSWLLVLFLMVTDFLHAVATLPYTVYLLKSWNPVSLDLSPYYVFIASTPLIIQLKINLTLTISIAVERILALSFPVMFRNLPFRSCAVICLLFGLLLAAVDLILEFSLSSFNRAPNCASIGCFLCDNFRYYWGISNMVMGIIVIILTTLILLSLRAIQRKPQAPGVVRSGENRIKQANRTTAGVLLISMVFVTLPSIGAGLVEMIGFSVFKAVGSFYIFGLLCAGAFNGVIFLVLNKEIRITARKYITCKVHSHTITVS